DIVVDEEYRGKGIGTKLITAAINQARKEGVKHIDFTSRPQRVAANRLYQRLGFKKRETNVYRLNFKL
ncbi:MAG: GNAT family N-acetyltransferase, partial [Patescibacteria group bacterium]